MRFLFIHVIRRGGASSFFVFLSLRRSIKNLHQCFLIFWCFVCTDFKYIRRCFLTRSSLNFPSAFARLSYVVCLWRRDILEARRLAPRELACKPSLASGEVEVFKMLDPADVPCNPPFIPGDKPNHLKSCIIMARQIQFTPRLNVRFSK